MKNTTLTVALALVVLSAFAECGAQQTKPNLLFILTDDQRDDSFSGMGHSWVQTPNVDTLLSRGMRFENAYIAEPTCRPSRAALLLGCHERVNRNGFSSGHKMTLEQWADSYPALLQKAGYETGFVGKWHIVNDGFRIESLFDFCEGHVGHGPFYFEEKTAGGKAKLITTNRHHTNNALRFLRSDRGNKPFCLSLCYATPHGSKIAKMHRPVDEPASKDERLKDHPIYGGKYRELNVAYPLQNPEDPYQFIPRNVMDHAQGRNRTYAYDYDPASNREHHYRYYQMITEIDRMVGELVSELKEQDQAKNTIIMFGSDHGLFMGEMGIGGKGLIYDLSAKFPCFIHDPEAPGRLRGVSRRELVSSLDLTVTLLDYAGVEPARYMTGRSLKPLVRGETLKTPWRDGLFLENLYTGRDTPIQEGFVDGDWKYIRCFKAPHPYNPSNVEQLGGKPVYEMLFSLKDDPEERSNLVGNPEHQTTLNRLRGRCDQDMEDLVRLRRDYANHYIPGN